MEIPQFASHRCLDGQKEAIETPIMVINSKLIILDSL
jgi:hypothetical protein